jgi:hypothetical protein
MDKLLLCRALAVTLVALIGRASASHEIDYSALVSRADLHYTRPTTRSEEGQPIGNGRMGSLLWTTPSALHFQINRDDVFAEDSYTTSFPKQDSDYASSCGFVDINLVQSGSDVFTNDKFEQHLSLYDAICTVKGSGVTAETIAWPLGDVMAIEVDDERDNPEPINIDLRMLRYAMEEIPGKNYGLAMSHTVEVHTAEHTAATHLDIVDDRIILTQEFREHDFLDSSAVAIAVAGRPARARYLDDLTVQLCAAPARGKFVILISSSAGFVQATDVAHSALAELDSAGERGFDSLLADTLTWWHDFWSRGFVAMHSPDGQADFVEANYTYFLYLMGASSRGDYPPRFGGMLWYTNGDMRRWGSQYWWANTNAYYSNLMPANRLELMDPMFNMYSGMLDACALAAEQQWGAQGIWIPEITFFNGPEKLPDDIAAELQELMLLRKPYEQHSAKFQWWAETKNRHNSRWNFLDDGYWDHGHYIVPTKSDSIFGHCTHILSDAARIGRLYYERYLFTRDKTWLRDRAYPIIKGAAEFYRTFPNVRKEPDGKYHIHHINNGESGWDVSDSTVEIAAMHLAFSTAIRTSTDLNIDQDLLAEWREMNDNLAPPTRPMRGLRPARPTGGDAGALGGAQPASRPDGAVERFRNRIFGGFVYGGRGQIPANPPDAEQKDRFLGFNALGSFIDTSGSGGAQILPNRLRLREGPGAPDAEHIGGLASGIHATLLNNTDDDNGSIVEVFTSAWPRSWDCSFKLLAHGGFVVAASLKNRQVQFAKIDSPFGGTCRIKNPWPKASVQIFRNGVKSESGAGDIISFETAKGESILLLAPGESPENVDVKISDW